MRRASRLSGSGVGVPSPDISDADGLEGEEDCVACMAPKTRHESVAIGPPRQNAAIPSRPSNIFVSDPTRVFPWSLRRNVFVWCYAKSGCTASETATAVLKKACAFRYRNHLFTTKFTHHGQDTSVHIHTSVFRCFGFFPSVADKPVGSAADTSS